MSPPHEERRPGRAALRTGDETDTSTVLQVADDSALSPQLAAILDRVVDPTGRLLDDAVVDVVAIRTVLAEQLRKPGTKAAMADAIDAAYSLTVEAAESLDELRDHLEPVWWSA